MPAPATELAPPLQADDMGCGSLLLWTWPLYDAKGRIVGIDRDQFEADLRRLRDQHVTREQILAEAEAELFGDLARAYGYETAALIRSKIAYARWAKGRPA